MPRPTIRVLFAQAAIADDPRARLIYHRHNTGPGGARNTILSNASGEFVAFFDDDDASLPNRISEQMATHCLRGAYWRSTSRLLCLGHSPISQQLHSEPTCHRLARG